MALIKDTEQIKLFMKKLETFKPEDGMYGITADNVESMKRLTKDLTDASKTIQKCIICGEKFFIGDEFVNLECEKSKNKLHIGNLFGKIENIPLVCITLKMRAIPQAIMVKCILVEYHGTYMLDIDKAVINLYETIIFMRDHYT